MSDGIIIKNGTPYSGSDGENTSTAALAMKALRDGEGNVITETYEKKVNVIVKATDNDIYHNSFYRGKDLTGRYKSGDLSDEIEAGTFRDIFIGDYFVVDKIQFPSWFSSQQYTSVVFRFARFQKTLAYLVTDCCLGETKLSSHQEYYSGYRLYFDFNITYVLHNTLSQFMPNVNFVRLFSGRLFRVNDNAISGNGSGEMGAVNTTMFSGEKYAASVLSEVDVFGSSIWSNTSACNANSIAQLPLFRLAPYMIPARDGDEYQSYWLNSLHSKPKGIIVNTRGIAEPRPITETHGVRFKIAIGKGCSI